MTIEEKTYSKCACFKLRCGQHQTGKSNEKAEKLIHLSLKKKIKSFKYNLLI